MSRVSDTMTVMPITSSVLLQYTVTLLLAIIRRRHLLYTEKHQSFVSSCRPGHASCTDPPTRRPARHDGARAHATARTAPHTPKAFVSTGAAQGAHPAAHHRAAHTMAAHATYATWARARTHARHHTHTHVPGPVHPSTHPAARAPRAVRFVWIPFPPRAAGRGRGDSGSHRAERRKPKKPWLPFQHQTTLWSPTPRRKIPSSRRRRASRQGWGLSSSRLLSSRARIPRRAVTPSVP